MLRPFLFACAGTLMCLATTGAKALQVPRTVWDGVYTEVQASRGAKAYLQSCSGCHRSDLRGGDEGEPPLRGPNFLSNWEGQTLAALVDIVHDEMPKSNPGSLPLDVSLDIVGALLKANGMPPGASPLSVEREEIERIRITAAPVR